MISRESLFCYLSDFNLTSNIGLRVESMFTDIANLSLLVARTLNANLVEIVIEILLQCILQSFSTFRHVSRARCLQQSRQEADERK